MSEFNVADGYVPVKPVELRWAASFYRKAMTVTFRTREGVKTSRIQDYLIPEQD